MTERTTKVKCLEEDEKEAPIQRKKEIEGKKTPKNNKRTLIRVGIEPTTFSVNVNCPL